MIPLKHRFALLLLVPVASQLILVSTMYSILAQAQSDANKVSKARSILSCLHSCGQFNTLMLKQVAEHTFSASKDSAENAYAAVQSARTQFAKLNELLVKEHDAEAANMRLLAEFSTVFARESVRQTSMGDRKFGAHYLRELKNAAFALQEKENRVRNRYAEYDRQSITQNQSSRERLKQVIVGGGLFAVVVSLFLAWNFSRTILRRLARLTENTKLLQEQRTLNAQLPGDDEIARVDQVFHDSAQRIQFALKKISESEAASKLIVDDFPQPVVTVNASHKLLTANPAAESAFGLPSMRLFEEHSAIGLFDILQEQSGEEISSLSRLEQSNVWFNAVRQDGDNFPCEVAVSKLVGIEPEMYMVTLNDISERLAAERWRQDFVSMVSHDVRVPLGSVQLTLDCVASGLYGALPEDSVRKIVAAHSRCRDVLNLVSDLLDIEKMSFSGSACKKHLLELEGLLKEALSAVSDALKGEDLQVRFAGTDLDINGDGELLLKALILLFDFVIRSHDASTLVVRADEAADCVCVSVGPIKVGEHYDSDFAMHFLQSSKTHFAQTRLLFLERVLSEHAATVTLENGADGTECVVRFPPAAGDHS